MGQLVVPDHRAAAAAGQGTITGGGQLVDVKPGEMSTGDPIHVFSTDDARKGTPEERDAIRASFDVTP